jgi:hypothetical protein
VWEQRIIQLSKLAEKKLAQIAKGFDSTPVTLEKQIAHIETELTTPVESKAATGITAEIRAHVKSLPTGKLHDFIQQAVRERDHFTMTAVLGAPAYLSGLNAEFQKIYLRSYHEHTSPELAQRLRVMQSAKTLIEERAGFVFQELEKAVGTFASSRSPAQSSGRCDKSFAADLSIGRKTENSP